MLSKIKKKFFSDDDSSIFKGMFTLLVGAGFARLIGLISIPILARIYTPEDYGVLALYISFVAIFTPIMTLRYVQAIPLPKTDEMAFNLFSVCFKLIIFFSLALSILFAICGEVFLGWFNMEALIPFRWFIVLGILGSSLYELFSLWATRKRQYKVIARTQFIQSFIGEFVKISLGLLAFQSLGMIIGQFISQSVGITSFIKSSINNFKIYIPKVNLTKEKFIAKYYQGFVWFRLPSQFLMVLSIQTPVMMMAALYDKETTGQLSLAMMALSLPVSLIGGAMAKAYYAEIAVLGKNKINQIIKLTFSVQKKLFIIGFPFVLLVYFLAEVVFKLVFGDEWALAGTFASILAPFVLFQFTSSPLMEVINVLGTQVVYLILHSLRIVGLFGVYYYAYYMQIGSDNLVSIISIYLSLFYLFASTLIFTLLFLSKNKVS